MNFFKKLFGGFNSVVKNIFNFILPIAKSEVGPLIAAALPYAKTIVISMMSSGLKGTSARDQAVTQLKAVLVQQGIADATSIGISTLNFIVETALQNLNTTSPKQ